LLLLEGGLRALDLPRMDTCWAPKQDYWVPDAALGFAYRPGQRVAGGRINALGLRGPVPPAAKPPGERRILYVGDSTAYGFGVSDAEAFWSLATAELAARHPGETVVPIVGAAPGYSSWQSRVLLGRLLRYRPDDVVFYVGAHNDHRRRGYYPDREIPARMARRHAAWHRIRTLRAFEYVHDRLGRWLGGLLCDPVDLVRVPPADFEANLRAMVAATRAAGARPLLLVPPLTSTLAARHPAAPRYREMLLSLAHELEVPAVDLQPLFAGSAPAALYLPGDDIHPNAAGHRRIAAAIARALDDAGQARAVIAPDAPPDRHGAAGPGAGAPAPARSPGYARP
jgi:lysophospholipase L1-like esterase